MKSNQKIKNLLRIGLDSQLAEKAVAAGYTLTRLRQANKSELTKHFSGENLEAVLDAIKRKAISKDVVQMLVEECDWKCCICRKFDEEGPVIIHHIVGHSVSQDDSYDNLVILCLNHHALAHSKWEISRHPLPPELLRIRKTEWIEAVKQYKSATQPGANVSEALSGGNFAPRIRTGKELVNALRDVAFYDFDYTELLTEDEAELVGGFLGFLQDLSDMLSTIEVGEIVKLEFQLNSKIKELEENKFLVFGERQLRKMRFGGQVDTWPVATLRIVRWTAEREAAAAEWDEIASKIEHVDSEERDVLFNRLVELVAQHIGGS